jgi:hypothetical protein
MEIQKIDLFYIVLCLSLLVNGVFVWYIRAILKKLFFISDNIDTISQISNEFVEHIGTLHELEMYYGEPALQNLLEHSKHVAEQMQMFDDILIDLEFLEAKVEDNEQESSTL